ncbi:C40 family peptidase [Tranquillimonas rosea]|uniref:C40 family peptidase n=1 Tax=Tranquillimonas rosea TaxID=641238 RepID=UPI003BAD887E
MSDRRLTPANGRVAAEILRGTVTADRYVAGEAARVVPFAAFLHATPGGARDRELLHGDAVQVFERRDGWAFVQAAKDSYCGYVDAAALGPAETPTHVVALRHTHVYPAPDIKQPPDRRLPFGAAVACADTGETWAALADGGHVKAAHLRRIGRPWRDPVAVAETFLGTPYLWAGNTGDGIDCSGLVQAALLACGIACPGDSDLQEALGEPLGDEAPLRRGDLVFWKGHVAMAMDGGTLIHANAHAMAVVHEDARAAVARIAAQGDGPVTARRRITPPGG